MDYSKTLNLPDMANSPLKADPIEAELEVLSLWEDLKPYGNRQEVNKEKPKFLIHDSPIPADAQICLDDAVSAILKDIILKYKLMRGFNVPCVPVWNSYNPSVQREVLKSSKHKKSRSSQSEIQKRCHKICSEYMVSQKEQFQRLGVFAYWDKAVLTSDSSYKSKMIRAFEDLYEAGYLHKGAKPTYWCINCQTDLAEMEVEYRDYELLSLYVKFPVIYGLEELGEDVSIVIWTNRPWTLAANTAISVNPDNEYAAVETEDNGILIMAASAMEDMIGKRTGGNCKTVRKIKGLELDKIVYAHPFLDRNSEVFLDRSISFARGTGCFHTTTALNQRDQVHENSGIVSTVDQNGKLTEEAGQFCSLDVLESGNLISLHLEKRGCLLASEPVEQPYPHCSYCGDPAIVRAVDKWIFSSDSNDLRRRAFKIVDEVDWHPEWSKDRISDTTAKRADWGISRQQTCGIPVPVFYCRKCNLQVDTLECINASRDMISKRGVERWLTAKACDILPEDISCNRCGGRDFEWGMEKLDMEFISAMNYEMVLSNDSNLLQCADICLWSDGQDEKWLQISMLTSMAIGGSPPFESALIHGSIVSEDGKRISRSQSHGASVSDLLDSFGADTLRLWAISMRCEKHLEVSHSHLEMVSKVRQRVKNTCRFLLANLYGYDPESDRVDPAYLQEVDHWVLHRLAKFIGRATKALEDYQLHTFYRLLYDFCSVDVSSIYLSMVKRRLYTFPQWSSSRRAVQTVMYEVLNAVTRVMAPVLSFTAEEIWCHIPGAKEEYPTVYLSHWPDVEKDFLDDELEFRWDQILKTRSEVYRSLEKVRQTEGFGNLSQAFVILYASSPDVYSLLERYIDDLEEILMVSRVRLMPPDSPVPDGIHGSDVVEGLAIEIRHVTGERCERCWVYSDTVGTNEQYPTLCYRCIAIMEGGTYYI